MTDWNKGQLILLVGACIAVFGSVYILASRGPAARDARSTPVATALMSSPVSDATTASGPTPLENAAHDAAPAKPVEPSAFENSLQRMTENPTAGDVAYLGDLAQRDGDARLRVMAIEGLQRAAMAGDDGGESSRALRQIAASRDPQISHAARRAIGQISAHRADE